MENELDTSQKFYLVLIIIFIGALSYRIFIQGQNLKQSVQKAKQEGIELIELNQEEKEEKKKLNQEFTTSDGKLSFHYSSEWDKIEDEKVLKMLKDPLDSENIPTEMEGMEEIENTEIDTEKLYEDVEEIEKEDLEEIKQQDKNQKEFANQNIVFAARKIILPEFIIGIITLQKIDLKEEKTNEEILKLAKQQITNLSREEKTTKITNTETKNLVSTIETKTMIQDRPTFKSKNIIFKDTDKFYILTFGTPYQSWDKFEEEFKRIFDSIEFNEN